MQDIDVIVKKVFKTEFAKLDSFIKIRENRDLTREELLQEYDRILESYRILLVEAAKITKIGDINQKKLFVSHTNIEKESAFHYQSSITDPLTNLHNRAYLASILEKEMAQSLRYRKPLSCILGDIDNFKSINDNFGHLGGDVVLKKTAEILRNNVRDADVVGRYGGEEFLIILPSTQAAEASIVAEKVRIKIAQADFEEIAAGFSITISLGVADNLDDFTQSQNKLLHNVDTALYIAKEQGKNRTVVFHRQAADDTLITGAE
jgi:diguanylate cyclase (GGDEF)-like protein